MSVIVAIRALANDRRLQILEWLKDPEAHFPPQADEDRGGRGAGTGAPGEGEPR